jgi:hypothetical protein
MKLLTVSLLALMASNILKYSSTQVSGRGYLIHSIEWS